MARPSRCRRVCVEPAHRGFAPFGNGNAEGIVLTVDEYEVIRLVDYEKKTHDSCAKQMDISRTTVTEIYERARFKLADCIVNGKPLSIMGGNYRLCDGLMKQCALRQCGRCRKNMENIEKKNGENFMKIAVTHENGKIFQHFGRTEEFKVYELENREIIRANVISTNGNGHGALAGMLNGLDVDVLICGGIGAGAKNAIAQSGIKLYGGVSGSADEAVKAFLAGNLDYDSDVHCDHHGQGDHDCGGHGHGEHGCGGNGCK